MSAYHTRATSSDGLSFSYCSNLLCQYPASSSSRPRKVVQNSRMLPHGHVEPEAVSDGYLLASLSANVLPLSADDAPSQDMFEAAFLSAVLTMASSRVTHRLTTATSVVHACCRNSTVGLIGFHDVSFTARVHRLAKLYIYPRCR